MTLKELIEYYSEQFINKKRGDDDIVILKDNPAKELQEAVYKAHQDRLPDDWIYSTFSAILDTLQGYDITELDDLENYRGEIVDGLVDVYTSNLTDWLNSSVYNAYYLQQAVIEFDAKENILSVAQYIAIDEIYSAVYNLLSSNYIEEENNEND